MTSNFGDFVNRNHPSYTGNFDDGTTVTVTLNDFNTKIMGMGRGVIQHSSSDTYFRYSPSSNIIEFSLSGTVTLQLEPSNDCRTLKIVDLFDRHKYVGTLTMTPLSTNCAIL